MKAKKVSKLIDAMLECTGSDGCNYCPYESNNKKCNGFLADGTEVEEFFKEQLAKIVKELQKRDSLRRLEEGDTVVIKSWEEMQKKIWS